ncbi:MAG: FtsL-like putative cell division protein [Bacteroidota bacterium]
MARKKKTSWAEMTAVTSMSANWVLKNIGFVLFLGFIVLTYIANSRYAQKNIREIEILQDQLKNQRRVYNALNAEVMNASKKEEIAEKVAPLGLKPSNVAPKKIVVESIENYGKE